MTSSKKLAIQLDCLTELSREELLERWIELFGCEPYKGIRNASLIRGIAYQLQAKAYGGLKPSTSKKLSSISNAERDKRNGDEFRGNSKASINAAPANRPISNSKPKVQMGSKLIREWNGRTYEVLVADKGFILNGVTYRSLSACAKTITGAHWSGPRFFGATS